MFKCPVQIKQIERSMTPTEKIGLANAKRLKAYVEEGLNTGTLPVYNGLMNRKTVAEEIAFGRSAYAQNKLIRQIADWADIQLGNKPKSSFRGGKTDLERELASEVQRLKDRNTVLKVDLNDAEKKLRELGYRESKIDCGDPRLPW